MHLNDKPGTAGFSIIELMIAMLITVVIALITTSFAANVFRSNTESVMMIQLSQEMRSAIQLISRDIRRSGYDDDVLARYLTTEPISSGVTLGPVNASNVATCLQVSYDNLTGTPIHAVYRWRMLSGVGRVAANFKTSATCATELSDSGWLDITDPLLVNVQSLEFTLHTSLADIVENSNTGNVIQVGIEAVGIVLSASLKENDTVSRTISNGVQLRNQFLTV